MVSGIPSDWLFSWRIDIVGFAAPINSRAAFLGVSGSARKRKAKISALLPRIRGGIVRCYLMSFWFISLTYLSSICGW